jgi:predicted amidohydrolase YtcJ
MTRQAEVVDATGADPQSDMVVIVTGETITEIGKFGKIEFPKNSQVIDATGKFLIPGLWDIHVHLTKAGENTLPLFIVNGVTSVRDMGGDYVQLLKWRNGRYLSKESREKMLADVEAAANKK